MARFTLLRTATEIYLRRSSSSSNLEWFAYYVDIHGKLAFARKASGPLAVAVELTREVDAIYGSFQLLKGPYVAFVTKSSMVCSGPNGSSIYRVDAMEWLPVVTKSGRAVPLSSSEEQDEKLYLSLLRQIASTRSFYYAVGPYDITSSLQLNDSVALVLAGSSALTVKDGRPGAPSPSSSAAAASGSSQQQLLSGAGAAAAAGASSPSLSAALPRYPPLGSVIPPLSTLLPSPSGSEGTAPSSSSSAVASSSAGSAALSSLGLWRYADERFYWNRGACRELMACGEASEFITPIINGFVAAAEVRDRQLGALAAAAGEQHTATAPSAQSPAAAMKLLLLSRRSVTRQGTRFNVRGSDLEGSTANFVETEQVLLFGDGAATAFVQLRGSIPLLWEQPPSMKYTPKAALLTSGGVGGGADGAGGAAAAGPVLSASSFSSFSRHMEGLLARYSTVAAVNLIDKKGDQGLLGKAYGEAVDKLSAPGLSYTWFDFHHECRKMRWGNLSKLLDALSSQADVQTVYARDAGGRVTRVQSGTIRTNCMDNLDRTNVVQSLFARQAALGAIPGAAERARELRSSVLTSPFPDFESAFNGAWADNADALSILYSGTGALKTDFTRTGKRTVAGALADGVNSVKRYVLNNFADGRTQDAWDLFVGRFVPRRIDAAEAHRFGEASSKLLPGPAASGSKADRLGAITSPAAAHANSQTPVKFLLLSSAVFAGLTIGVMELLLPAFLPGVSTGLERSDRVLVGALCASAVLATLAYFLVGKGLPLGKQLVSRPVFVPLVFSTSSATGAAAGWGDKEAGALQPSSLAPSSSVSLLSSEEQSMAAVAKKAAEEEASKGRVKKAS